MAAMAYDWLENWYSLKFATPEQLNGRKTNLEPIVLLWSPSKLVFVDSVNNPTWPPRLIMQLLVFLHYPRFT